MIFGGGRQCLMTNSTPTEQDPIDTWACSRRDGLDLIDQWQNDKKWRGFTYAYLNQSGDLDSLDIDHVSFVMGEQKR